MAKSRSEKSGELFFTPSPDDDSKLFDAKLSNQNAHLRQLMLRLERLEDRIEFLEARGENRGQLVQDLPETHPNRAMLLSAIQRAFRDRAARKKFFSSEFVVGEPAWDILLDLATSTIEGKRISISSACIASGVPSTTALRWISLMESANLVEREQDERDSRRTFLNLTANGFKAISDYFIHIGAIAGPTS